MKREQMEWRWTASGWGRTRSFLEDFCVFWTRLRKFSARWRERKIGEEEEKV